LCLACLVKSPWRLGKHVLLNWLVGKYGRMQFVNLIVLLGLLTAISYCDGQSPSANKKVDADLLARFESEAPDAWQECKQEHLRFFKNSMLKYEGTYATSNVINGKMENLEKRIDENFVVLKIKDQYGLANGQLAEGYPDENVRFYNKSYYATLRRKKTSNDWFLESAEIIPIYDANVPLADSLSQISPYFGFANPLFFSFHPYDENPLIKAVSTREESRAWPELRDREIIGIDHVDYDGKEMVRVIVTFTVYSIDWNSEKNGQYKLIDKPWRSTAVFDPANNWCLREVAGGALENGRVVLEYKRIYSYTEFGRVQICNKYTQTVSDNGTPTWLEVKTLKITEESLSPDDFTLSAFGLPEPDWYRPPTPWWRFSVIGVIVLVITGVAFFRFAHRRKS